MHPITKQRREMRNKAAQERQAERNKRTPKQQLARLDEINGPGLGAVKERARLHKQIEASKAAHHHEHHGAKHGATAHPAVEAAAADIQKTIDALDTQLVKPSKEKSHHKKHPQGFGR